MSRYFSSKCALKEWGHEVGVATCPGLAKDNSGNWRHVFGWQELIYAEIWYRQGVALKFVAVECSTFVR